MKDLDLTGGKMEAKSQNLFSFLELHSDQALLGRAIHSTDLKDSFVHRV